MLSEALPAHKWGLWRPEGGRAPAWGRSVQRGVAVHVGPRHRTVDYFIFLTNELICSRKALPGTRDTLRDVGSCHLLRGNSIIATYQKVCCLKSSKQKGLTNDI